ncbi:MAG TPA: hypothetical protein VFE57_09245 [Cyclobacteriaceae bacterium]|jgi:orotate phosphoribosyltransferase|nr:hypothetical protein [Cyclobacteriaceae bacterium]
MEETEVLKNKIIDYYIQLSAAGFSFEKPIEWASGTYNPPYIDNRILSSDAAARAVLRKALPTLVENKDKVDYVFGIPKAGIAPATLLALEIGKPLLFKHSGKYYSVDVNLLGKHINRSVKSAVLRSHKRKVTMIAGTVPFGIICGIIAAEKRKGSFLFVREVAKDHGKQQQVEGLPHPGDKVVLVDPYIAESDPSYREGAIKVLQDLDMYVILCRPLIGHLIHEVTIEKGTRIVGMEDLVSTGESMLNEIIELIAKGAVVQPCSIYDYELSSAVENFSVYGLTNKSLVNFEDLLEGWQKQSVASPSDVKGLRSWHENQPDWGNKNGFPSKY